MRSATRALVHLRCIARSVQEEAVAVNQWRHVADAMHGAALEHLPLTLNCAMREHLQSSVRIDMTLDVASAAAAADDDDEYAGSSVTLE